MLPLCKFYRYLIYRLYHFQNDTPTANVIITLGVVHGYQFLTTLIVIDKFTRFKVWPDFDNLPIPVPLAALLFLFINFLLFYNKKKWKSFDIEFKNETPKHKRIGFWVVIAYLIVSVFGCMAFTFWIYS